MSFLQRLSRTTVSSIRSFSTARPLFNETTTTTTATTTTGSAKGLSQFFENGESLPKQIWTGNNNDNNHKHLEQ